jgi:hypothetical protein
MKDAVRIPGRLTIPRHRLPARRVTLAAALGVGLGLLVGAGGCAKDARAKKPVARYQNLGPRKDLPPYMQGSIYERAEVAGTDPYPISAFGLVGRLRGTGDAQNVPAPVRQWMNKEMYRRGFGLKGQGYAELSPERLLASPDFAIVQVDAALPPGARAGDRIDAWVSALPGNRTSSLAHGVLFRVDLKEGGADPQNPAATLDILGRCEGPVLVNPAYALGGGGGDGPSVAAKASVRQGVVMAGGEVQQDRPMYLQLRQPQLSMSRAIEGRINQQFQAVADRASKTGLQSPMVVAEAQDEGVIALYVPRAFAGDWEHFAGVVSHLFLNASPEFGAVKARQLAEAAVQPDAPLADISFCWEGLGAAAMPSVTPLMTHADPAVAFAAARAAAVIGDPSGGAQHTLARIAGTADHPFQITAIQVLGRLPATTELNHRLRALLGSDQALVRIEAYKVLAGNRDNAVYSRAIKRFEDRPKFMLDVVPSDGPPLIYASRRGTPRIAIMGRTPALKLPVTFQALDNRLTISSQPDGRAVTIFYRDPRRREPVRILSRPDVAEIAARLAGEGPTADAKLDFTYGEIVAILQSLGENRQLVSQDPGRGGGTLAASFVLQDAPRIEDVIYSAPAIPESGSGGRPQGETPGPVGRAE